MSLDLKLDPLTRDLVPGIVTGADEILQRLVTRLKRELGEWFLNTDAGLPWYQQGRGMLGAIPGAGGQNKRAVDLRIRREVLGTDGVQRILKLNTVYSASSRAYSIYLEVIVEGGETRTLTIEGGSNG